MTMNFQTAYGILVDPQHEGRYSKDSNDPGGETYRGISRTKNPAWRGWVAVDVHRGSPTFEADMDRDTALQGMCQEFYRQGFWLPLQADSMPETIRYELFDFAVNTSQAGHPATAIKCLQRALGVPDDGALGPVTIAAAGLVDGNTLFRKLAAQVIRYYTGLRSDLKVQYLSGWMNRLAANLEKM